MLGAIGCLYHERLGCGADSGNDTDPDIVTPLDRAPDPQSVATPISTQPICLSAEPRRVSPRRLFRPVAVSCSHSFFNWRYSSSGNGSVLPKAADSRSPSWPIVT